MFVVLIDYMVLYAWTSFLIYGGYHGPDLFDPLGNVSIVGGGVRLVCFSDDTCHYQFGDDFSSPPPNTPRA